MKKISVSSILSLALTILIVGTFILEANARARGGGMRISRSGPASGGSFASRPIQPRATREAQPLPQTKSVDAGAQKETLAAKKNEIQSNLSEATEGSQIQSSDRQEKRRDLQEDRYVSQG